MREPDPQPARDRTLFDEAVALPCEDVAAFLGRACPDDPVLRDLVADLVASYHESGKMLPDEPALWQMTGARTGQRIGHYRLERIIGQGGFGEVWLASQEQPVQRPVALKILKLGLDTLAVVARFEAERQTLAMMDHPNVARIYDAGSTAEGRPYFVMEYLDGAPLFEYAAEKRLGIRDRLRLIQQAAAALQHAHQNGIIHRDLKPSNILVVEVDGKPVTKVIDFGVAKMIAADEGHQETLAGQHWGTPAYMSPEQAAGRPVDTRTDVFSLGLVLFELLVGIPVRKARTPEPESMLPAPSRSVARMPSGELKTIAQQRAISPQQLAVTLRGELDWIVLRAGAIDPAERYESAASLRDDIERYLSGQAVAAGPQSTWYRARKYIRRNRGKLIVAGMAAILLVAATIVSLLYARRAETSERGMSAALYEARLTEARAVRQSGRKGQRLRALEAIVAAAQLRPTAELRDEAIAAMALADLKTMVSHKILSARRPLADYDFESGLLVTGEAGSRQLDRWQMSTGEHLGTVPLPAWMSGAFKFRLRPGGREILVYADALAHELLMNLIYAPTILEVKTGRILGVVPGADFDNQPGIYFDSGKRLALAMADGGLALCDADTGQVQRRIPHAAKVRDISTDEQNRRLLVTLSDRPSGLLMDYDGEAETVMLEGPPGPTSGCLAWDGRCGIFGTASGAAAFFDPSAVLAGEPQHFELRAIHSDFLSPVRSVGGGRAFVSSSWDTTLRLWSRSGGQPLVMEAVLRSVSKEGSQLLVMQGQTVTLMEAVMPDSIVAVSDFTKLNHRSVSFSADGHWAAVSSRGDPKSSSGTTLCRLPGLVPVARLGTRHVGAAFGAGGAVFTAGGESLQKWLPAPMKAGGGPSFERLREPAGRQLFKGECQHFTASPDGRWLASAFGQNGGPEDRLIRIHTADNFTQTAALDWNGRGGAVDSMVFDPQGRWLAVGYWKGDGFDVWSTADWKLYQHLQAEAEIVKLAVSPDGQTLATTTTSELRLWDTATWQVSRTLSLPAVSSYAHCIAWSPRGDRVACEMDYGVVAILRPDNLEREMTLTIPDRIRLSSLTFSTDGEMLAVSTLQDSLFYDFRLLAARLAELGLAKDKLQ